MEWVDLTQALRQGCSIEGLQAFPLSITLRVRVRDCSVFHALLNPHFPTQ
jgi:hypothetical protein